MNGDFSLRHRRCRFCGCLPMNGADAQHRKAVGFGCLPMKGNFELFAYEWRFLPVAVGCWLRSQSVAVLLVLLDSAKKLCFPPLQLCGIDFPDVRFVTYWATDHQHTFSRFNVIRVL